MKSKTGIACYWVEPTDRVALWLRRYVFSDQAKCPNGYHNVMVRIEDGPARLSPEGYLEAADPAEFSGDLRWPTHCPCGYEFQPADEWQVFQSRIYSNQVPLRELGPGAMYDATWNPRKGPDGRSLHVILPDGHTWAVDSRANNCTMPKDDVHRCWVRHGDPPLITVDKNGLTCGAGGGSIQTPNWHGHLKAGVLVPC